jgi:hypothetical protein
MSQFIVNNLADSGDGSLRAAIELANAQAGKDEIVFDSQLQGGTIKLTSGELGITDSLTIKGLGTDFLAIDADKSSRIFKIDDGNSETTIEVEIEGLIVTKGFSSDGGGGILNSETLQITNSSIIDNSTPTNGAGIYNQGNLTITRSNISNNSADLGGGIYNQGTAEISEINVFENIARSGGGLSNQNIMTITNSQINNNSAKFGGGGIFNADRLGVSDTDISGNDAYGGGGINNIKDAEAFIGKSKIDQNQAANGGGIYNDGVTVITENIIVNNTRDDVYGTFTSDGSNSFSSIAGSTGLENDKVGVFEVQDVIAPMSSSPVSDFI